MRVIYTSFSELAERAIATHAEGDDWARGARRVAQYLDELLVAGKITLHKGYHVYRAGTVHDNVEIEP